MIHLYHREQKPAKGVGNTAWSLFDKPYRKSIGVGLPPKYWNAAKHRAKVSADFDGNIIDVKGRRLSYPFIPLFGICLTAGLIYPIRRATRNSTGM